ncbi:MAG: Hsp33 family molecular chaperone [Parvularculaceae bacterium]
MDARDDFILPFQVGEGAVRGRIIRLGSAIDQILSAHQLVDPVRELVGEAATLTALMGASLKFDGKLIFQAQGDGPVRLLVADYVSGGALRAMASVQSESSGRGFGPLLGTGHIALTIDQGPDTDRYQGVTPIEGATLESAAAAYFERSEQIPTIVRLAVGKVQMAGKPESWRAGGVIVQFMPSEGGVRARGEAALKSPEDSDAFDRAAALLQTAGADELLDPGLSPETLLYRLYHEDGVRVFEPQEVRAECGCNAQKISAVLSRYSPEDLAEMAEDGKITVDCEFCRREYYFDANGLEIVA